MAKKKKGKRQRLQKRIMGRRLGRIIEFILIMGVLTLELIIGRLQNAPQWFGTPLYYGLLFGILIIGFWVLWVWADTGEKTEIDELEEKTDQYYHNITKSIDRLTREIRKERKQWYARNKSN